MEHFVLVIFTFKSENFSQVVPSALHSVLGAKLSDENLNRLKEYFKILWYYG